jgi:hypothetical protein
MAGKVLEIRDLANPDYIAEDIAYKYQHWGQKRIGKEGEWIELRNFIFATDTTTTTAGNLPWKNKTTLPKIAQIRDNLHANYMAALFPNDEWLLWVGEDKESVSKEKAKAITSYMRNKVETGGFQKIVSRLLYDYIDYGNAIADADYVHESHEDPESGEMVDGFIGPRAVRVSPADITFNPLAPTFEESPKIRRMLMGIGELKTLAIENSNFRYDLAAIERAEDLRHRVSTMDQADILKSDGFAMDGFDTIQDYYGSSQVEVLEFVGNVYDEQGNLKRNRLITIIDRQYVVRDVPNPSWNGGDGMSHVGWRMRPDNLYGMGPLDNLVGMQYRIDHLENIKADLFDFVAHPPLKIRGDVEAFDWEPFAKIEVGDDGDVEILKVDTTALAADTQIQILEQRMEEMAGAPREAMGIRSPGEKTAFEVQKLDDAASRIFQEKIRQFEVFLLEPLLNNMLEVARRHLNTKDIVMTIDDDIGVKQFMTITKDDISARGKLRAKGASHFAARNLLVRNLSETFNSQLGQVILPHVSSVRLAKLWEESLGYGKHNLVEANVQVKEQQELQRQTNAATDQLDQEQAVAIEEPLIDETV